LRTKLCALSLFVLFAVPWGCGGDDDGAGLNKPVKQGKPCEQEKDCADDDPCTYEFCIDAHCEISTIDNGEQPGAEQVSGDCLSINCKSGKVTTEPANDPPEDEGADCTVPACNEGEVVQIARDIGESCAQNDGSGVCDADSMCVCSPVDDGPRYVNAALGVDDDQHGGGSGACAYATLTYAIAQAPRRIRLAAGEYSANTGETLPFVLTQNQRLSCYDEGADDVAVLSGEGAYNTTTATVVFEGAQNQLQDCGVDGGGTAEHAVLVVGAPENDGHEIFFSDIRNADVGVSITGAGSQLSIGESSVHDNATAGLAWDAGKNGFIEANSFSANGTDITCADGSPGIQGTDNGGPSCSGCQNCPF